MIYPITHIAGAHNGLITRITIEPDFKVAKTSNKFYMKSEMNEKTSSW